jgi:hypothetical protein
MAVRHNNQNSPSLTVFVDACHVTQHPKTKQPGDHRYKLQPPGVSQSAGQTDSQTGKSSAACTGVKSLEFPQFNGNISLHGGSKKILKDSPEA